MTENQPVAQTSLAFFGQLSASVTHDASARADGDAATADRASAVRNGVEYFMVLAPCAVVIGVSVLLDVGDLAGAVLHASFSL